jgi:hypothetical protein
VSNLQDTKISVKNCFEVRVLAEGRSDDNDTKEKRERKGAEAILCNCRENSYKNKRIICSHPSKLA